MTRWNALHSLVPWLFALSVACAAGERPGARDGSDATALPTVTESGSPAQVAEPVPGGDPPLCVAVDLGTLDSWLGTLAQRLPQDLVELLDREFDGLASELRRGAPLQQLGLDTARPATLLLAPLDPSAEAAVDELAGIAAPLADGQALAPSERERFESLSSRLGALGVWARVTLPVEGSPRLLELVRQMAGRDARPAPPGVELLLGDSSGPAVAVWRDGTSLVADIWAPFNEGPAMGQVVLLRGRSLSWPAWAPAPAVGASTLALHPARLARLGFAQGVAMVRRALSSVDPSYAATLAAAGLREAHRAITIAEGADGAAFDRVVAQVHADEAAPGAELVAELRAGAQLDTGGAPTAALTVTGASFIAQVAPARLARQRLPGTTGATEPGREFTRVVEEAGVWGFALSIPYGPQLAGNLLIEEVQEAMPTGRFESVGLLRMRPEGGQPTRFGVLPATATAAEARCALVPEGGRCGRTALRPGATVEASRGVARLQRVGDRWVVLVADARDGVELAGLGIGAPQAGPLRVSVDGSAFVRGVPEMAWTAPLISRSWVFELAPTPTALRATLRSGPPIP